MTAAKSCQRTARGELVLWGLGLQGIPWATFLKILDDPPGPGIAAVLEPTEDLTPGWGALGQNQGLGRFPAQPLPFPIGWGRSGCQAGGRPQKI